MEKKIGKKILFVIAGLVLLEMLLRLGGLAYPFLKDYSNKPSNQDTDTYKILCLGESTTEYGDLNSWPAQLETILNEKSTEKKFKVINGGIGGINTAFILSRLEKNIEKYNPNMIITMMGANDGSGQNNNFYMIYENKQGRVFAIFKNFRTYKLIQLIWPALNGLVKKIQKSNISDLKKTYPEPISNVQQDQIKITTELQEKISEAFLKIKENSNNEYAYIYLGILYRQNEMFEEAEQMYKKALQINPSNDQAYLELSQEYMTLRKFEDAEQMIKKALEINPNNENVYIALGDIYMAKGKFEEAEQMYKKALQINPNNGRSYDSLTRVYIAKGQIEEAKKVYKNILQIQPNNENVHLQLGRIYTKTGEFEEAEQIYKKALEINPNNDQTYLELGQSYMALGRFEEAEEALKKGLEINPANYHTYVQMGILYRDRQMPQEFEEFYKKGGDTLKLQKSNSSQEITKYHYNLLYQTLKEKGIKLIAMQYPTKDINELKNMFKGNEDVTFISNKENFQQALTNGKYEDYFIDKCYKTFGHATPTGNKLIAENVANTILKELKIPS